MKKLLFLICVVCAFSSCSTIRNSATHKTVNVQPISALTADIDVYSPRITYTMKPDRKVRRGGFENVKSTAVREALQQNGNGDVLVGLETQIKYSPSKKIMSVVITGYPAKYKNFRNIDEKVWYTTPYFQVQPSKRGFWGTK